MRSPFLGILLLIGTPVLLPSCGFEAEEDSSRVDQAEGLELLVRATHPELRTMERALPITAKVIPVSEAEASAQIQGVRIESVAKDVGDRVEKGDPLAVLETVDLKHAVIEAEAAVEEAQQRILEAELQVKELKAEGKAHLSTIARKKQVLERLKKEGRAVARDDVDAAQYEYDTEVAKQARYAVQIQKAKVAMTLAERQKSLAGLKRDKAARQVTYAVVRAPMGGVVTERMALVGKTTMAGQVLFRLYDPQSLVARAKLAQHHLRHVREGQKVRFQGDAFPNVVFTASLALIEPQVDRDNGMVALRLRLDPKATHQDPRNATALAKPEYASLLARLRRGDTLRPGMFVSGQIVLETKKDTLSVPRKAVSYARGLPFVYVVEEIKDPEPASVPSGGPTPRRVRRIYFDEGLAEEGWVEFLPKDADETLGPDQLIVLVGQDRLKDGDKVRLLRAQKGATTAAPNEPEFTRDESKD